MNPQAPPPIPATEIVPGLPIASPSDTRMTITREQLLAIMKAAGDLWPSLVKFYPHILMLLSLIGGLGVTAGWWAKPPVEVPVASPVAPPITPPAPAKKTLTVYFVAEGGKAALDHQVAASAKLVSLLGEGHTVLVADPKVYAVGSAYQFDGKAVPLPCAALANAAGMVIDVVPFATAADLVALLTKHAGK